ncbi:putative phage abortive infection protein [Proteus mirabilis]|uniref:putative phage abortive infection protein n=10 Tax=Proteus mirabilis TaxID=584 RepID=UPI0012B4D215|nr:putative phage abortive infection protein [Proteus mirabilis]MBG3115091.1 hypothetical protein [Proteus mirabilis]QGM66046.1 hypothetical protein F4W58_13365 [Proteus mirabilis]QGM69455.1 hypothetical protein F4W60_12480 [Proteus mirabilis]QGM73006.1 hypothetical protein F4W59_13355 [Proteus mirabilis]HBC8823615.1 hypothetical protein [Proteus mirabilis]
MKLTSCVKFFLLSLVGAITLVFICWGWNTSLQDIWINYSSRPEPWVGIFTACVLGVTAYASYKAGESAKIAGEMLELSRENGRKDDFIKQFTLLIEQHDKSHEIMMKVLDTYRIDEGEDINWNMTIKKASDKLYLNHQFSPYMRMLFRVLKHCDENFYIQGDTNEITKEKKKYTSIVRSMIRNDVLYFVAINSMNESEIFNEYRNKLKKFYFFEHLITDNISEKIRFTIEISEIKKQIKKFIKCELIRHANNLIKFSPFLIVNDEDDKIQFKYSFGYKISSEYAKVKYNKFKSNIENELLVSDYLNDSLSSFYEIDNHNDIYLLYSVNKEPNGVGAYFRIIHEKIDGFNLKIKEISSLILNDQVTKEKFHNYIEEKYDVKDFIFSSVVYSKQDIPDSNNFLESCEMYKKCSSYIQNKNKKIIVTKKEEILNDINRTLIKKLNQTHFIKESGERFILNEENKIVFENKNS